MFGKFLLICLHMLIPAPEDLTLALNPPAVPALMSTSGFKHWQAK
jgi:hypothetical protein